MKEFIEQTMKQRILKHLKKKRDSIWELSKEKDNYTRITVDTYDEIIRDIERFEKD